MPTSKSTEAKSLAEQIVNAMQAIAGRHTGYRPAHAKGVICAGVFRATAEAARLSRAEHLRGQPVPAIVRFSNASGNPFVHDGLGNPRSLAVKFPQSNGRFADVLGISIDGFPARTPEELLAFLQTQLPDEATGLPAPERTANFIAHCPAAKDFIDRLEQQGIPTSYARSNYHALHAFRFIARNGSNRMGRYHFITTAGEAYLSSREGEKHSSGFLLEELAARLGHGPVSFNLIVQLALPGDPTHDPSLRWPHDRPTVDLGRLEVSAISPTSATDERNLVFDPANLTDGIELSDDPFPLVRSEGYAISFFRRNPEA